MSKHPTKKRLDVLLTERGLAESRQKAQALVLAGEVLIQGQPAGKAGGLVPEDAVIELRGGGIRYVGRGGLKLEGALADFGVAVAGRVCADVGSATGGFTDCLLQNGAARVYAIDVSPAELAWKLRSDPRVVQIECNARHLTADSLAAPVSLVVVDLSFISTAKVLAAVASIAGAGADLLILVKPQFELDRARVGRGGIVKDPRLHEEAVARVRAAAERCGLVVPGEAPSRLKGAEGNQEFFLHARKP